MKLVSALAFTLLASAQTADAFQTRLTGKSSLLSSSRKDSAFGISDATAAELSNQATSAISIQSLSSTKLCASSSTNPEEGNVDVGAIAKYGAAIATQISLFYGLFSVLDLAVANFGIQVPFAANVALFYVMSLRSRIFNPLSNKRPDPKTLEAEGKAKRNMPSWTPPGVIFPIMWILIIGPLRATSTAMVYDVTQSYLDPAILAFALHLSIGDTWNTINNVEQRSGAAVTGVGCVWLSKANAAFQYFQVSSMAGQLMSIPLIWLTVASALVTATWRLNPNEKTGEAEPLYPVIGNASTEFAWFSSEEKEA